MVSAYEHKNRSNNEPREAALEHGVHLKFNPHTCCGTKPHILQLLFGVWD